jgi:hypothetical protein
MDTGAHADRVSEPADGCTTGPASSSRSSPAPSLISHPSCNLSQLRRSSVTGSTTGPREARQGYALPE